MSRRVGIILVLLGFFRSLRLAVRISASHAGNRGSIPLGSTNQSAGCGVLLPISFGLRGVFPDGNRRHPYPTHPMMTVAGGKRL